MKMDRIRQVVLMAVLLLPAPASMACSCIMYDSLEDAQARATVAVRATMASVRSKVVQQGDASYLELEIVRWRINEALRGPLTAGREIETRTQLSPAACGNQVLDTMPPPQPHQKDVVVAFPVGGRR